MARDLLPSYCHFLGQGVRAKVVENTGPEKRKAAEASVQSWTFRGHHNGANCQLLANPAAVEDHLNRRIL